VSIQKQIGMSNKQIVKLRYASNTRLTGGVSNLRELQFRLNGLFDPDFSLGGHQPMGFDEWSAFYGRYRVKSAKCKIRAVSNTTVNVPMAVIAYPSNSSATVGNLSAALEQSLNTTSTFKILNSNSPAVAIGKSYSIHSITGQTPQQYNADEDSQALVSADPVTIANMHIVVASIDGVSIPDCYLVVEIVYIAELFDKFQLAQS